MFKSITSEIEDCITKAEILSLNGDAQAQKESVINELTKCRQRFLNRINEVKVLLQMAIRFFHNNNKLDELITESGNKYKGSPLPNDLLSAETLLRQHFNERENIRKLVNFTSGEGNEIINKAKQHVIIFCCC